MTAAHGARMAAIRVEIASRELGALVVSHPANVRYLTGYVGSNGTAVISREGAVLVTDSRYAVSAREQVTDAEVVIGSRDLLAEVARAALEHAGDAPIGVEADSVTLGWHERFEKRCDGRAPLATSGLVERLRQVKDADEVAAIRRAAAVVDAALARVMERGIVGRRERDVAFELHGAVLDEGGEDLSFPTIVAAGANGARPHAVPGVQRIPPDTLVVIDMGAIVDGYCSDMTRTLATGVLDPALAEAYATCLEAQRAALGAVRPGITGADLDAVARRPITDAGHGDHFGHGLGHGVGLEIHEAPGVRPGSTTELLSGMTVTIEPGIYLEGVGGVRIEDLVLVTDEGCDIISATSTDLRVVA